jgi:hypothetical protein
VDADTRMACSLVLSLVISADNLRRAATGEADILQVGVRYVVAFLVAFVAVGMLGRVLRDYVDAAEERRLSRPDEQEGVDALRLADE